MCDLTTADMTVDLKTPRNVHLSAFYKRSFAFYTVKTRMPVILTQIIDNLVRSKEKIAEKFEPDAQEELKTVIGMISKLKYEIQTNKPLRHLVSDAPDIKFYNDYIISQSGDDGFTTHFSSIWLLTECYMYRRIREAFESTAFLHDYDPFEKQKQQSFYQSIPLFMPLAQHMLNVLNESKSKANKEEFIHLIKLNLWGNKCDLSLSNGVVDSRNANVLNISHLEKNIICNHSDKLWDYICSSDFGPDIVDVIFDNAGYELFTDLCLADYIITKKIALNVRFYVKAIPWFISDVMSSDFHWMIDQLKTSEEPVLNQLGTRWSDYVENGIWTVVESYFWTLPVDFSTMSQVDSELYQKLAEAKVAIFKGDLNYRKLFGEKNWDPTTDVTEALQNFHPTKVCSLRTVKSDIICGITEEIYDECEAGNPRWMETGDYGLIQFSTKVVELVEES